MKILVKKLNENAVMPFKTYDSDFCFDVVATSEEQIGYNIWKYGIGLAFQLVRDEEFIMKKIHEISQMIELDGTMVETKVLTPKYFDFANSPIKLSIDLRPRSSVWKTGMILSNCTGTIDESYRGEVSAVFYHVNPEMKRYTVGDKIGQIKLGITFPMDFVEVNELDTTERNTGGYGSTGH